MAEFIDHQAEESEFSGEEEENNIYEPRAKKQKVRKHKRVSSDDDEEEDEEADETEIRREMRGFVVEAGEDDDIEGENDDDKSDDDEDDKDDDDDLDEDDLELIQRNLDIEPEKRRGRVQIESDDDDDRERIGRNLFPEQLDLVEAPAIDRVDDVDRSSESDGSDVDNFIVGDDDDRPIRRQKHDRRFDIPEHALDEAREVFGVDDFNFDEFYDEAGDEEGDFLEDEGTDELERRQLRRAKRREKQITLLDQMEPSDLDRGFLNETDKRVQLDDRPERFQMGRMAALIEADDNELSYEADWIYTNAFRTLPISMQEDIETQILNKPERETKSKIREALKFMRNQLFEVPFIAFYRKEYVEPELGINDLWKIYQWDEKWCLLQQRMQRLSNLMKRMQTYLIDRVASHPDQVLSEDVRLIEDDEIAEVGQASSVGDLTDMLSQFHLYYGADLPNMFQWEKGKMDDASIWEGAGFKQASRNDAYQLCVQSGLSGLAAKFGLSPSQFAENLVENYTKHEVEQYPVDPLETAQDYVCRTFSTADAVLTGVKYMVAKQLSRESRVRKVLRDIYRNRAVVCARPTRKGRAEIDENHIIYTKKYIRNKPVKDLEKDEFLRLVQAQENGLLALRVGPDGDDEPNTSTMVDDLLHRQFYYRDEFSSHVEKWNKLRDEALTMCLTKFLQPMFEKELRQKLLQESRDFVVRECCLRLYGYLKVGPYEAERHNDDLEESAGTGVRVMGIAYPVERGQASFCAMIDGDGEVVDYIRLIHLTKRRNSTRHNEAALKEQDLQDLKRFVLRHRPHVIALAGETLYLCPLSVLSVNSVLLSDALTIRIDVESILTADGDELQRRIPVEIFDNDLARVYMNSSTALCDFADYPAQLRQAVSLARRLQDPLPEFCQLCNLDEEILYLGYHSLQDQVPKEELLFALTLEFINRVNEVGVDMNRCLEHPHTQPMLQFVCGLGPRKANQLCKVLKHNDNLLESRTKLVTLCRMGPKVFMNCAGFIKIDTVKVADKTDSYVEVLDGSRVHPETYEWARKMAVDALELDEAAEEENPTSALEEILEAPERLKDLDLDAFAEELQRQGFGNKSITLYDIRAELNHRYKDLRSTYKTPNREDVFNMLTKETPQTFNVGKLVMGKVMHVVHRRPRADDEQQVPLRDEQSGLWKCPRCHRAHFDLSEVFRHLEDKQCPGQAVGVKVRLENGITGFIPNKYISDRPESFVNPGERVQINQPIYCRVLKVDTNRFQAELSCRSSDLSDKEQQFRPPKDRYYDFATEDDDRRSDLASKTVNAGKTSYVKRVIAHPSFHNITYKDAERMLQDVDQGEAIIRPSSKGCDHLTVTWKVADGIYQHIDVIEEKKHKPFSLGKLLRIGEDDFEDLDEIIARYVQPMAAHARDIMSFKYYLDGDEARERSFVEASLVDEKSRTPTRIPYTIVPSVDLPGKFMLSYLPRSKVQHEYLTVTPDGFRFRQQMFPSLPALFKWFKDHFRDPKPRSNTIQQTPLDAPPSNFVPASTVGIASRFNAQKHQQKRNLWDRQATVDGFQPYELPPFVPVPVHHQQQPPQQQNTISGDMWGEEARNWGNGSKASLAQNRARSRY